MSSSEPFKQLLNQGMILGADGTKMSKSKGNVVNPDEIVASHGAPLLLLLKLLKLLKLVLLLLALVFL